MNRFEEMIQRGNDLVARTNELLNNDINLETSGSVDIATYLTDLKAIHAESLEFTNPDVAESLEQYREGMNNDEYMEFLTQYLTIRAQIMGELRDRIYDRTAKVDMAFNAKVAANNALYREMKTIEADIEAINKDIDQLDKTIGILRNSDNEAAIEPLENAKQNMLARIAEKEARIEAIKREQEILLHGGVMPAQEVEHEAGVNPNDIEHGEEELGQVENPPLPEEESDDDSDEEEEEEEHEQGQGAGFVPVFPELEDGEDEELEEEEDDELGPLPVEDDGDDDASDDSDEEEEEEEEDEDQELTPVPEDEEEIEVIHHTDAKPTLLRRIGNVVYAVITFLGSCAMLVGVGDHFINHHDVEPAQEQESQIEDEDDLEDTPAPEDQEDDKSDDVTPTPDDQTQDDQTTPDDQEDEKDDDKTQDDDQTQDDDKTEDDDKDEEKDQESELGELPAELAPGEYIYDNETGLEVTSTGDAYVHVGDVTLDDGNRDLTETDHGTVVVGAEDMTTDQKLPELTGNELTYDEVTEDMTAQEISDLDAALAEWAAQFDTGLTLKP